MCRCSITGTGSRKSWRRPATIQISPKRSVTPTGRTSWRWWALIASTLSQSSTAGPSGPCRSSTLTPRRRTTGERSSRTYGRSTSGSGRQRTLRKGYGETMMRRALQMCFAEPAVTAIVIDPLASNTRAHKFYRRLGFVPEGRRVFGDDDCLVHRLTRLAWRQRFPND
jgi:hypothetical protein